MENITAMPRMIDPLKATNSFILEIKSRIEKALPGRRQIIHTLDLSDGPINWIQFGANSGAYFTTSGDSVGFVYYYRALPLKFPTKGFVPAEALAFRFEEDGLEHHGRVNSCFFENLLPKFGLVLTDSQYTADGKKWWYKQYSKAVTQSGKYGIVLLDTDRSFWEILSPTDFHSRYRDYWGSTSEFEKYRFGIFEAADRPRVQSLVNAYESHSWKT